MTEYYSNQRPGVENPRVNRNLNIKIEQTFLIWCAVRNLGTYIKYVLNIEQVDAVTLDSIGVSEVLILIAFLNIVCLTAVEYLDIIFLRNSSSFAFSVLCISHF